MKKIINSISKRLFQKSHLGESIAYIHEMRKHLINSDMIICFAHSFRGKGYYKSLQLLQNTRELKSLVDLLSARPLETICEIGTNKGGTFFIWTQIADDNADLISIDLPGGNFGGGYSDHSIPLFESFSKPHQKLNFLRGSSHSEHIRSKFVEKLDSKKLDFLFIDGDHTYEGVSNDFAFYSKYVKLGGIIAFHDILPRQNKHGIQVHRFWNEIKGNYKCLEYIDDSENARKIGIGVIIKE